MPLPRAEIHHLDLLKTVLPLRQHEMTRERIHSLDLHFRPVRHQLLPVRLGWAGDGRRDHPEVLRTLVRADVEKIGAMVDVVLVAGVGRRHRRPQPTQPGVRRRYEPRFGGGFGGNLQHEDRPVARAPEVDVEQLVLLVVDKIGLVGADDVPEELVVALGNRVLSHVEQRLVVAGPAALSTRSMR
jgi:hypothetical protein